MGQKVDPNGLRTGIIRPWTSKWYADKAHFSDNVIEDNKIRKFIKSKYYSAKISYIAIERAADTVTINIFTARPSDLIGKGGAGVEQMTKEVKKLIPTSKSVTINVHEVKQPDADAQLVAENIATRIEGRERYRSVMKQAISRAQKVGVKGIKIVVSGRLDGAEIAKKEEQRDGSIPLQTLRANIEYGVATAHTTFGAIGVKVWIYKGEVLMKNPLEGGMQ